VFDRLGLTTRITLLLSPPFFVLVFVLLSGSDGSHPAVVAGTGASFLISVALSGWFVRSVVAERRDARRLAQALRSAQDNLTLAEVKSQRDRELQLGFEEMEEALIGGLEVAPLAEAVITSLCRYVGAPVGAIYLRSLVSNGAPPVFTRSAGFALDDLNKATHYELGQGLVGQVAKTGQPMEILSPPEAPLVVDDGLRRRRRPNVLALYPLGDTDQVIGVICLGLQEGLKGGKRRFTERILRSVAMAFQAAMARQAAEATLKDFKDLASRLQHQQEVMQSTNQRLEEQAIELERAHQEAEVRNADLRKAESEAALRADEASRANEYKSEFLANMSHELRTPLNSIILLSKLLSEGRSGVLSDEQSKQASVINQAGGDLLSLINDILDLSKIEAGRMSMVLESTSLHRLLADAQSLFAPLAERKQVALNLRVESNVPDQVVTDPDRLKQILRNFLSNAVKFVDSGQVEIFASLPTQAHWSVFRSGDLSAAVVEAQPSGYLVVGVSDTGIGIPEDRQLAIFEAFRQADGTTSRRYGGTGLGLNIVTKLADLLGGSVGMSSTPGEGSCFFVVLPLRNESEAAQVKAESSLRALPVQVSALEPELSLAGERSGIVVSDRFELPQNMGKGRRLLLVDDDVRNTYALTIALESEGFEIVTAANGVDALEVLDQALSFDAVLMDIMMPEMDGYEAMRRLRADGRFDQLPVIALTARTQEDDRQACFEAGATEYLTKPIDHHLLMERLEQLIRAKETP
jgi:two-component system chemotaxis sensor kinase CheA